MPRLEACLIDAYDTIVTCDFVPLRRDVPALAGIPPAAWEQEYNLLSPMLNAGRLAKAADIPIVQQEIKLRIRGYYFEWQTNVVRDKQVNAFCLPAGKIFVFTGILRVTGDGDDVEIRILRAVRTIRDQGERGEQHADDPFHARLLLQRLQVLDEIGLLLRGEARALIMDRQHDVMAVALGGHRDRRARG